MKKKLEDDPDSLLFVPLAEAYRKEGALDDAYQVCKKGLEKNPDYSNAHLVLGRIFQAQTKLEESVLEFKSVLQIDPENLLAHSLLGSLYMEKTDYQSAIDEYQAILTLNPDDDETQTLLKIAIEKAANIPQPSSSVKEIEKAPVEKKVEAGNMASLTMAELYLKQGHLDKAVETYEELLKKDPANNAAQQKLTELKETIPVPTAAPVLAKIQAPTPSVLKADKPKPSQLEKNKDSKFSDDDILFVMAMDRNDKSAKPLEKATAAEPTKPEVKETETKEIVNENQSTPPNSLFSPARIEALKTVLADLASITGIRRCFLTDPDGISVVSVGENSNNDSLEKQTMSIFKDTSLSAQKLSQGSLRQVLVTAETGHILLVSFAGGILVVLADHQINLGMLRLAMDGAAKKVEKVN